MDRNRDRDRDVGLDIDISDILAEVSRPGGRPTTGSQAYTDTNTNTNTTIDTDASTDHQLLTRAWTSERSAPDLLPYPTELMERIMARVQAQIQRIEDLASSGGADGVSSSLGATGYGYGHSYGRKGPGSGPSGTQNANLILSILQTDLSRTQFLVRSFLRQRLAKLTKHAGWYLAQSQLDDGDSSAAEGSFATRYLGPAESQFLRAHQALLSDFYGASFLDAFPPALRRLDDSTGGVPMVEPPDSGTAVVARCLVDGVWSNERDFESVLTGRETDPATVELRMRRGEVWVVRWRDVRGGVERGELELL